MSLTLETEANPNSNLIGYLNRKQKLSSNPYSEPIREPDPEQEPEPQRKPCLNPGSFDRRTRPQPQKKWPDVLRLATLNLFETKI